VTFADADELDRLVLRDQPHDRRVAHMPKSRLPETNASTIGSADG